MQPHLFLCRHPACFLRVRARMQPAIPHQMLGCKYRCGIARGHPSDQKFLVFSSCTYNNSTKSKGKFMFDDAIIVQSAVSAFNNAALYAPAFLWWAVLSIP